MLRWGGAEPKNAADMGEEEIHQKFQVLKKDAFGNHNLLKSRACETCLKTDKRGTPFGIQFWAQGDKQWPTDVPRIGKDAEPGCFGCGWYDLETWREELNRRLQRDE